MLLGDLHAALGSHYINKESYVFVLLFLPERLHRTQNKRTGIFANWRSRAENVENLKQLNTQIGEW